MSKTQFSVPKQVQGKICSLYSRMILVAHLCGCANSQDFSPLESTGVTMINKLFAQLFLCILAQNSLFSGLFFSHL